MTKQKKKRPSKQKPAKAPVPFKREPQLSAQSPFAKMSAVERIMFAHYAVKHPVNWRIQEFFRQGSGQFQDFETNQLNGFIMDMYDLSKMIDSWQKQGLIVNGTEKETLTLRREVQENFWQWLANKNTEWRTNVVPEIIHPASVTEFMEDFVTTITVIRRGSVKITQANNLAKTSIKEIEGILTRNSTLETAAFSTIVASEGAPSPSLSRFGFLLNHLYPLNLIHSPFGGVQFTAHGESLITQEHPYALYASFVEHVLNHFVVKGIFLLLPIMKEATDWTSLGYTLDSAFAPYDRLQKLGEIPLLKKHLLEPLQYLGLMDWGEYDKDLLFRFTPLGQLVLNHFFKARPKDAPSSPGITALSQAADFQKAMVEVYPFLAKDTAYVQPNFEILVPRAASWATRLDLDQYAVLANQDHMLTYRLEKIHFLGALKKGTSLSLILAQLQSLSPNPLPDNVRLTLEEWGASFGQAQFLELSLLECATPELAISIGSGKRYHDYVLGFYSPTTLIIREREKLRKLLETSGIYPEPEYLDGAGAAQRSQASEVSPDPESPPLQTDKPPMAHRAQTPREIKEILKQAITAQISVRFAYENNGTIRQTKVLPLEIQNVYGANHLVGQRGNSTTLYKLKDMQWLEKV